MPKVRGSVTRRIVTRFLESLPDDTVFLTPEYWKCRDCDQDEYSCECDGSSLCLVNSKEFDPWTELEKFIKKGI